MAKKTDKKPVKKPVLKQKQTQKQSVIINLGDYKKKVRVRRKKESPEKKEGLGSRGITMYTANYAPPPTYNKFEPQRYMSEKLPLSFYETNRPMNMGFNFQYPTVVPIATQTERNLIPTLENQLDDNLEINNNESSDLPETPLTTPSSSGKKKYSTKKQQLIEKALSMGIPVRKEDTALQIAQYIREEEARRFMFPHSQKDTD